MTTHANSDLAQFFARCRSIVDQELDRLLPQEYETPFRVHQAIRWSIFGGGKRFRPILLLASGETFGVDFRFLLRTACALEMIHTYSLIHDDLPSMDDDDLRRGQATCHVRFDEATAILAGDALQTLAFKAIANDEQLGPEIRVRLMSEFAAAAATPGGMVAGQAEDLEAESRRVTPQELETIHRHKTGALIVAAARAGAIIAAANERELTAIGVYADRVGLLFQITDDLLDISATAEALGKTPGKDARSQKATYPGVHGIEVARARAIAVHQEARAALEPLQQSTVRLRAIADFILHRER
ncbi:MAG TPA: farnesyl diphosphate synthase [Pyrinomonadaceae bacterium]